MKSIFKRLFHKCSNYLEETGVWMCDGAIPVTGIPTPCGDSMGGVMFSSDLLPDAKQMRCSICGCIEYRKGKPASVSTVYRKGRITNKIKSSYVPKPVSFKDKYMETMFK